MIVSIFTIPGSFALPGIGSQCSYLQYYLLSVMSVAVQSQVYCSYFFYPRYFAVLSGVQILLHAVACQILLEFVFVCCSIPGTEIRIYTTL
jgi:hypothetical protein